MGMDIPPYGQDVLKERKNVNIPMKIKLWDVSLWINHGQWEQNLAVQCLSLHPLLLLINKT